jgi:hypothetical protein
MTARPSVTVAIDTVGAWVRRPLTPYRPHPDRGRMTNKSKPTLTAIRIPLLVLVALLLMLSIGVFVYSRA